MTAYGKIAHPVLSPELLALVRDGQVYSLQQVLHQRAPVTANHVPLTMLSSVRHGDAAGSFAGGGIADDMLIMSQHTGTHVDALCHVHRRRGEQRVLFGDVDALSAQGDCGYTSLGVERMPPVVARGVLLDIPKLLGCHVVADEFKITSGLLDECTRTQKIHLNQGDCVLLRTGIGGLWDDDPERVLGNSPGIDLSAARWLVERGAVLVGSDTTAVEVLPSPGLAVHLLLMVDFGVPLVECLNLEELARDGKWEFLFIMCPLK